MTGALHRFAELVRAQTPLAPEWERVLYQVDRALFVPDTVWVQDEPDLLYRPIRRAEQDPDRWRDELVYANEPIVTQVDLGTEPVPDATGSHPSSSTSMPSLVFRMLDLLDPDDGDRVLEIGTGTGWNAALLCERLGEANVTTIEVDPRVAAEAENALHAAGYRPTLVVGDGAQGHPPGAPYDHTIATCGVQRVPPAWIAQTRAGGRVLLPWGSAFHNGALLLLTVGDGATATGRFVAPASFMWLRGQYLPWKPIRDQLHHEDQAQASTTGLDPRRLVGDPVAEFAIGLCVPDCEARLVHADDQSGEATYWLFDTRGESWAAVEHEPGASRYRVEQYGPRALWDEVEATYRWWEKSGRPGPERFGATVGPAGQRFWLDQDTTDGQVGTGR